MTKSFAYRANNYFKVCYLLQMHYDSKLMMFGSETSIARVAGLRPQHLSV